jgi:hypothetical protein
MPVFTQTLEPPEVEQVPGFIAAAFPGEELSIETSQNKVTRIEMPGLTQGQFDQLILDLTAAFPGAMTAENDFDIPLTVSDGIAQVWTAMPSALTEFRGLTLFRTFANLAGRTQAQLIANVQIAGAAGAGLRIEASLNGGSSFRALDVSPGTGPQVSIAATGTVKSASIALDPLVRKEVLLRVVGGGGNGVLSPAFGLISMRVR